MAIRRVQRPPHPIALATPSLALYEVALSAVPSRVWRAAFLRPPSGLTTTRYTPKLGRLGLDDARVTFRTSPPHLHQWLRRIDRWITYANSEPSSSTGCATRCAGRIRMVFASTYSPSTTDARSTTTPDAWRRLTRWRARFDGPRGAAGRKPGPLPLARWYSNARRGPRHSRGASPAARADGGSRPGRLIARSAPRLAARETLLDHARGGLERIGPYAASVDSSRPPFRAAVFRPTGPFVATALLGAAFRARAEAATGRCRLECPPRSR